MSTNRDEISEALAARVRRIDEGDGYRFTLSAGQVHVERSKFSPEQDVFPAVSVNYLRSDAANINDGNPRYVEPLSLFVIHGAIKRGKDDVPKAKKLLADMERAVFARLDGDAIHRCGVLSFVGDLIDTTTDGQTFVYVYLTVTVQWCNDNLEQDDGL